MPSLLLALLLLATTCGQAPTVGGEGELFASLPWYEARDEPETIFCGRLEGRDPPRGPGARTARTAALVLPDGSELPVYTAGIEKALAPWLDRLVVIEAKRVDVDEGFGEELWAARIRGTSVCPGGS